MSHGQTREWSAGGLHHRRPNAKGRDTSERGGGADASIQSEATMRGGKPPPSQATFWLAVTTEVSKVDARFATRREVFGFASAQWDTPPTPLLSIPAVGQCHPSLHKRSFSLSPRANMSA